MLFLLLKWYVVQGLFDERAEGASPINTLWISLINRSFIIEGESIPVRKVGISPQNPYRGQVVYYFGRATVKDF